MINVENKLAVVSSACASVVEFRLITDNKRHAGDVDM